MSDMGGKSKYVTATGLLWKGKGILRRLIVSYSNTVVQLVIHDNTAASGTTVFSGSFQTMVASTLDTKSVECDIRLTNGAYLTVTGGSVTVNAIFE